MTKPRRRALTLLLASLCWLPFAFSVLPARASVEGEPSPVAQDVDRLIAVFDSQDEDLIDEALVQLRWAGISDARLYQHLLATVRAGSVRRGGTRALYIEALGYSGNAAVYADLRELSVDLRMTRGDRDAALEALTFATRYTEIATVMSVGSGVPTTVEALWAQRHRTGLRVSDGVRVRLAARDLYLHRYGRASLDVAAEVLRSRLVLPLEDRNVEDAMAFLCKALGLSGIEEYKVVLVEVANTSSSEKVADYAERAAQYFEPAFERNRRRFESPPWD